MDGRTVVYRGSLKSCNYHCSYCPFSKHAMSKRELEKDNIQWKRLVQELKEKAEILKIRSLLVTPYGEALIHPWYWEGFAALSALDAIDALGAQTNLSFSVEERLHDYHARGGSYEKLHLWATFHPEMTTIETFVEKCKKVQEKKVKICAGAVGVPKQIPLLRELRAALPREIYLWVNRMDGLKRPYTEEEKEAFLEIDPYFFRELTPPDAEVEQCQDRLFIEGNGRLHTCNISRSLAEDWEACKEQNRWPKPVCGHKICSCYLAYGGRKDLLNQVIFGPYSLFRVPRQAKAVFLDIAGTLVPEHAKEGQVSPSVKAGLMGLYKAQIPLFFATTLPYEDAARRCKEIWYLFQGGVFSGGAHVLLENADGRKESVQWLKERDIQTLEDREKQYGYRILRYEKEGHVYKITLLRSQQRPWEVHEAEELAKQSHLLEQGMRYLIEGSCLQILSANADKVFGIRKICEWMGILPEETIAFGDSTEDQEMMKLCVGRT